MIKHLFLVFSVFLMSFAGAGARADHARPPGPIPFSDHARRNIPISYYEARNFVALLYNALLFREPDEGGLRNWSRLVAQGGYDALVRAAGDIASSPEFRHQVMATYGSRQILANFYYVLLQRQIDPSGYQAWLPLIRQGRAHEVARGIVGSPEFARLYFGS
jgi:hypothetical protein